MISLKPIPSFSLKLPAMALFLVLFQGALLSGCSTHSAMMVDQVDQQTNDQQRIQQVMEALQITESRVAKAQSENVEIYAPEQIAAAKDALSEARRYSDRFQADPDNVNRSISLFFGDTMGEHALNLIAEANESLDRAEDIKQQADTIFAEANENFVWLKKYQAPVHFRYEYSDLTQTQNTLIKQVASGNLDSARRGLPGLLREQRALEIAAAQRFYLYDINQQVIRQEGRLLDRYASLSYSGAVGALNKAKATIAEDTRNESAILAAKAEAEFALEIANAIAADMQQLVDMDRQEMERWLLLLTAKLNELGGTIGADDVRNHKLMQQLDLLTARSAQNSHPQSNDTEQVASEETAEDSAAPTGDTVAAAEKTNNNAPNIDKRMTDLEQTLGEQIKALSEQLKAMKAEKQSAQATPDN